jgi:hypothetical protein
MLRQAGITGRAPAYQRAKVREDSGVFLRGSRGQCRDPRRRLYGQFAGILQVEIRQRVSHICMFMIIACEETIRSRLAHDIWHNGYAKKYRGLFLEHYSDLRMAYGGILKRLLRCWRHDQGHLAQIGWPD